jgi:hypothetical protein
MKPITEPSPPGGGGVDPLLPFVPTDLWLLRRAM